MAKTGRPRAAIDQKQFENLCRLQCTEEEILGWFGITDKTLNRWCRDTYGRRFSEIFKEKRMVGYISLRRSQWRMAETNPTMALWLGKQYLGQRDPDKEQKELNVKIENNLSEALKAAASMKMAIDDADDDDEEEG